MEQRTLLSGGPMDGYSVTLKPNQRGRITVAYVHRQPPPILFVGPDAVPTKRNDTRNAVYELADNESGVATYLREATDADMMDNLMLSIAAAT